MLSQVIGTVVGGPDGSAVGRVLDLTVSLADPGPLPMIDRVLIRPPHARDLLVPWSMMSAVQRGRLSVAGDPADFAIGSVSAALDDDEILLGRDVLDTQIVDVSAQRLARVADVVLVRTPDGNVEVVGVEVGFSAVLRRLGLRRLAARAGQDAVAWSDLHLTSDRGHEVQLATPRSAVHHLDARGLATLVSRLDVDSATEVLAARDPHVAAEVVRVGPAAVGERVLRALPGTTAEEIVAAMPAEHARSWRRRLARPRARRFLRSHVWPRRA